MEEGSARSIAAKQWLQADSTEQTSDGQIKYLNPASLEGYNSGKPDPLHKGANVVSTTNLLQFDSWSINSAHPSIFIPYFTCQDVTK